MRAGQDSPRLPLAKHMDGLREGGGVGRKIRASATLETQTGRISEAKLFKSSQLQIEIIILFERGRRLNITSEYCQKYILNVWIHDHFFPYFFSKQKSAVIESIPLICISKHQICSCTKRSAILSCTYLDRMFLLDGFWLTWLKLCF